MPARICARKLHHLSYMKLHVLQFKKFGASRTEIFPSILVKWSWWNLKTYSTSMAQIIFHIMRFVCALLCAPKFGKYECFWGESFLRSFGFELWCFKFPVAPNFFTIGNSSLWLACIFTIFSEFWNGRRIHPNKISLYLFLSQKHFGMQPSCGQIHLSILSIDGFNSAFW